MPDDDPRSRKHTVRGYSGGESFSGEESEDFRTAVTLPPFVEVELVYERGQMGMETEGWHAIDVWTQNNIYSVDWSMKCVSVADRRTGKPDPAHPLLGSFLAGGQRQDADAMELTYPCPRPGQEAVFEYKDVRKHFVNTSTVTRVVLRLRVITVPHARLEPAWDRLTSSHNLPAVKNPEKRRK